MYVKTKCPKCGDEHFHNLRVHLIDTKSGPSIKMVESTETIAQEDLISKIIHSMAAQVKNGIEI